MPIRPLPLLLAGAPAVLASPQTVSYYNKSTQTWAVEVEPNGLNATASVKVNGKTVGFFKTFLLPPGSRTQVTVDSATAVRLQLCDKFGNWEEVASTWPDSGMLGRLKPFKSSRCYRDAYSNLANADFNGIDAVAQWDIPENGDLTVAADSFQAQGPGIFYPKEGLASPTPPFYPSYLFNHANATFRLVALTRDGSGKGDAIGRLLVTDLNLKTVLDITGAKSGSCSLAPGTYRLFWFPAANAPKDAVAFSRSVTLQNGKNSVYMQWISQDGRSASIFPSNDLPVPFASATTGARKVMAVNQPGQGMIDLFGDALPAPPAGEAGR
jgi:hypothetical protein